MNYSMRRVILLSTLLLCFLATCVLGIAAGASHYIRSISEGISPAIEGVRAAGELEKYLRAYSRQGLMYESRGEQYYSDLQASSEVAINRSLEAVGKYADGPEEAKIVRLLKHNIENFFGKLHTSQDGFSPLYVFEQESLAARQIEGILTELMELKYKDVERIERIIATRNVEVTRIAAILSLLVLVFCISLVLWMYKHFYRSVGGLGESIVLFGQGDRKARANVSRDMPQEFKSLSIRFNEMTQSLESQRDAQLSFLAGIAHDLRNPLSAIQMASADLSDECISQDQLKVIKIIERQVTHLDRMVGDLLDTTRIEAGKLELKLKFENLSELAHQSIALFKPVLTMHTLHTHGLDCPVFVHGDATRLNQVLNNLLSNAIKYSPDGGEIAVEISSENGYAILSVKDEGIGIAIEDAEKIFEPFQRSEKSKHKVAGVGLGLSVARRIVEGHRGTIEVSRGHVSGAVFKVMLPLISLPNGVAHSLPESARWLSPN